LFKGSNNPLGSEDFEVLEDDIFKYKVEGGKGSSPMPPTPDVVLGRYRWLLVKHVGAKASSAAAETTAAADEKGAGKGQGGGGGGGGSPPGDGKEGVQGEKAVPNGVVGGLAQPPSTRTAAVTAPPTTVFVQNPLDAFRPSAVSTKYVCLDGLCKPSTFRVLSRADYSRIEGEVVAEV
jgi:hypothetical protein